MLNSMNLETRDTVPTSQLNRHLLRALLKNNI